MPSSRGHEGVLEPGSEALAGGSEVVGLQRVEDLLDHPFGDRLSLPDQFPHAEIVVAGTAAVAISEGGLSGEQQNDEVVRPQASEPVDRGPPIGFGLGAAHDLRVPQQGVLGIGIVRRGAGGPTVVHERLFVATQPLQDFAADQPQVGPVASEFQGAVDRGERRVLLVLPEQRDGQVGVTERLVGHEVDEFPVGALGLDLALVLELRVADAVEPHLLLGRLRGRRGRDQRGEDKQGGELAVHG